MYIVDTFGWWCWCCVWRDMSDVPILDFNRASKVQQRPLQPGITTLGPSESHGGTSLSGRCQDLSRWSEMLGCGASSMVCLMRARDISWESPVMVCLWWPFRWWPRAVGNDIFLGSTCGFTRKLQSGSTWEGRIYSPQRNGCVKKMGESHLVGGLEHLDYFPFHIWDGIILPVDELHHFSRRAQSPPTRWISHSYIWFAH